MPKLKVLKHTVYLESIHRDERILKELDEYHEEIEPVYFRTGEYLLGDKCWFEVRGRAFTKRKEDFEFELRQLHMKELDISVVNKLKAINNIDSGMLSKEQLKIISDYEHFLHIRKIERTGRKRLKEFRFSLSKIIEGET